MCQRCVNGVSANLFLYFADFFYLYFPHLLIKIKLNTFSLAFAGIAAGIVRGVVVVALIVVAAGERRDAEPDDRTRASSPAREHGRSEQRANGGRRSAAGGANPSSGRSRT